MKKALLVTTVLCWASLLVMGQQELSRKERKLLQKKKEFAVTDSVIQSKSFTFDADNAVSSDGLQIELTTHIAYINILNDTVVTDLPYFGRAYNVTSDNPELGIKFDTQLLDFEVQKDTVKYSFDISFQAKTEFDNYKCTMVIYYGGSANLSIISNNRALIRYNGKILPYATN